jgi:hypothetical protein
MIPPTFVISLNEDLGKQGKALREAGLDPVLFKGVNGRKGEHSKYEDRLAPFCEHTCPGSVKGIGLSHILLAEHLYQRGVSLALILEDDAFPFEKFNLEKEIDKVLSEVPEDWEIIKLHTGGNCINGSNTNKKTNNSAAAYLINTQGLEKLRKLKLVYHIDIQQNYTFNIYKSKMNLFWTDESKSTNRKDDTYFLAPILEYINPVTCGEQNYNNILSFTLFRIPFTNIELTNYQVILILVLIFLISLKIFHVV